ncbi:hypothetical protein GGS23DRAFT_366522 [Durotheca rogersii]|uniref:uncharacterized protein n=1 Tax=Durotheca rogersii TaxID=419775 RepID=UPI002220A1D0|nr:uncharacterized protein GGS23DRAFT_366522 [Durotheca rogersii]KAI5866057.1 hypothetical protein GGS23DRAFT_366522 [Durotheca rogersii]
MSYGSPYGTPHHRGGDAGYYYDVQSPSPTPSPRHYPFYPAQTPQRPATRAHVHHPSAGYHDFRPSTAFSPRYKSTGEYATGLSPNVSSRSQYFSTGPRHERQRSFSFLRAPRGDSDEVEFFEVDGHRCVLVAGSKSRQRRDLRFYAAPGQGTDNYYQSQGASSMFHEKERADYSRYDEPPMRSATRAGYHARRSSATAVPIQRPSTARPSSSHRKRPVAVDTKKATEADAKKHSIPAGYSLKNWDPAEEPIMLLGSVFDSNSLGKWIYDWTVHHHGASTPIADVAGELWVLLIQLSGKIKRAEEVVPEVRTQANKEMIEDFIESGERLTDKLRALLKKCEAPMLRSAKTKDASHLGQNAGVEFVKTVFGRERELERTEAFMQQVRLWNLRFDANCEDILKRPKQ